ncbi:nuclear transport factor 2 family protein [Nocardiopsis coralliicola]
MSGPDSGGAVAALVRRIEVLEAEAEIRRLQARYLWLCDTPLPEPGVDGIGARVDLIAGLYTDDAVWEGVGEYYDGQFGRMAGRDAIRRHFLRFWGEKRDPELVLNAHYLTSEQIRVDPGAATARGEWIHMQPWLFSDGTAVLRSSRLSNTFAATPDGWKISRTRTENVFVAPLPAHFPSAAATRSVLMAPDRGA